MKISKKINEENKAFWDAGEKARMKVAEWPEWKRSIKVTKFSTGFPSKSSKFEEK